MIIKSFELKKIKQHNYKFYLFYGDNEGLKEETIKNLFEKDYLDKTHRYEEREILDNISKTVVGTEQNLVIEYTSPPRCKNPCGINGPTEGPKLNQNAQIQIHSADIVNHTTKIYEQNLQKHGLDVDQSIKTSNDACILQMIACIICSIISLIIVWKAIKMAEAMV